jgi:hypothetical protein
MLCVCTVASSNSPVRRHFKGTSSMVILVPRFKKKKMSHVCVLVGSDASKTLGSSGSISHELLFPVWWLVCRSEARETKAGREGRKRRRLNFAMTSFSRFHLS